MEIWWNQCYLLTWVRDLLSGINSLTSLRDTTHHESKCYGVFHRCCANHTHHVESRADGILPSYQLINTSFWAYKTIFMTQEGGNYQFAGCVERSTWLPKSHLPCAWHQPSTTLAPPFLHLCPMVPIPRLSALCYISTCVQPFGHPDTTCINILCNQLLGLWQITFRIKVAVVMRVKIKLWYPQSTSNHQASADSKIHAEIKFPDQLLYCWWYWEEIQVFWSGPCFQ